MPRNLAPSLFQSSRGSFLFGFAEQALAMASRRMEQGAKGGGGHAGEAAEGTDEVALIREAGRKTDLGKRSMRGEHAFAGRADAEPMDVFADAFPDTAAKDTGEMDGMDLGFASEFGEGEPPAMLGLHLIHDAGKPRRGVAALERGGA